MTEAITELARGFRKRTWVTTKLAAKVGAKYAKRTLTGKAPASTSDTASAQELVEQLGSLKGLVMKVGQMASYLPGALPPDAQRVLESLQSQSTAMAFPQVAAVIREELGDEPHALFDELDEEPFAAASIGQVHRAVVDGQKVAVKVQYPGIEELLRSDLKTFGVMAKVSTLGLPLDAKALVSELRGRMLEECDYRAEAANQRRFAELFADDPDVHVPEVVDARSSQRVLSTRFADRLRFRDFVDGATREAKDRAGLVIFRTCFDAVFRHRFFNGDPHPGNYLFDEDGRVTFLDFGCVRSFDDEFVASWKAFARCVLAGEREDFEDRLRAIGMVGSERRFDFDAQWELTRDYLYKPFLQRDPFFTYTDEYVRESYGTLLFDNPNQRRTAMPPEWLLLNRLQWGLNAVLAQLEATAAWPDAFRAAVES